MKLLNKLERPDLAPYEHDIEKIFIEINKVSYIQENILVGFLYRPPGNDIRIFNEKVESILQKMRRENEISYILGDVNINIPNDEYHQPTGEFCDLMWSN